MAPTGETCPAFDGGAPTELKDGIIKKPAFKKIQAF